MGATKGKQKKSNEELVLAMELSVTQHKLKTQITADAKEIEKQNEMQKKRSRINWKYGNDGEDSKSLLHFLLFRCSCICTFIFVIFVCYLGCCYTGGRQFYTTAV